MTIRLGHLGDSHLDERNRLDDNVSVHKAFVEQAREAKVDVIAHSGDFFHRRSSVAERNALAEFLVSAAEVAPVVGVKGNHDAEDDLNIFNELRSKQRILLWDRPDFRGVLRLGVGERGLAIHVLPWFSKANLVAGLGPDVPADESDQQCIVAAQGMLDALRQMDTCGSVPILLAHALVAGSQVSTGQTLLGRTVELSPGDLSWPAYTALGHVHKHQAWGNVVYSGSPERQNFGEAEPKGWLYVEIDEDRWQEPGGVRWEFRELPAREMRLIEVDATPAEGNVGFLGLHVGDAVRGAIVRMRYRIRPEDLHLIDEQRIRQEFIDKGAHSVTLEPILVHEARARAPEIASAESTWEKVNAFWQSKRIVVSDAQKERVRAILAEIERGGA